MKNRKANGGIICREIFQRGGVDRTIVKASNKAARPPWALGRSERTLERMSVVAAGRGRPAFRFENDQVDAMN
jgi:hypothetical protein